MITLALRSIVNGTDAAELSVKHDVPRPRLGGRMKTGELLRPRRRGHADKWRRRGQAPIAPVRSATGCVLSRLRISSVSSWRGGVKHNIND